MSADNLNVYMPVVMLMFIAVATVVLALLVGKLIRPHNPFDNKEQAYECGEDPIGIAWSNFNVRFYVVSLIFIIFDVEGALLFPVAAVFKSFIEIGEGSVILATFALFILVLAVGIVYCWRKGDLDWVKGFTSEELQNLSKAKDAQ
ncbi:MAG: NADH-quinone oxidoreductase subunit A [Halobacteriovoraceae bacterium]|jgi:NADH-quinone oxidoreductase subunit A|nr:NADH-quinone oxidoreductase subunit A [Halobacteriovoraceae bacterium]MBT5094913.1 NADH-quinone oxidoreductase subunit A [Halobacteriovoraceae bacterium]